MAVRVLLLAGFFVLAACERDETPMSGTQRDTAPAHTAADIADNNRGVALMGYFDYPGAREVFAQLVERRPDWHDAQVNLAIATLNRQQEGDEARALDIVAGVLERDPGHLRAHYVAGLLRLYLGETDVAERHFRLVAEGRPDDAYAAYYLGQVLVQSARLEEAIAAYERAMELDPYLRSAYYGAALAMRRAGRTDQAAQLLEDYQRFENNPRARLAEFKYTRMGPLAETLAVGEVSGTTAAAPVARPFAAPRTIAQLDGTAARSTLTTVDIDADGDQDLYVTGIGEASGSVLLFQDVEGRFAPGDHALAAVTDVTAAAWGDIDNDGLVDAYLCRDGANQLWRQDTSGWQDISAATGTDNGDQDCADTLLIDADHDGDLDIFVVNRDGPNELYNNNLDGTFRALAGEYALGGRAGSRNAIATDIDNDRDLDLIVIKTEPPHELFVNDRLWRYRPATLTGGWAAQPAIAAVAADTDADGFSDLVALHGDAVVTWSSAAGGWHEIERVEIPGARQLIVTDFDGDGSPDRLAVGDGWRFAGAGITQAGDSDTPITAALALYRDRGPALVTLLGSGELRLHEPAASRHAFVALELSGKEQTAESMRSNRFGIGTRVALRVGSDWRIAERIDDNSGAGQSLQPLMLGLGDAAAADFVALTWPDGVFQTELDLAPGRHRIEETQRQLSSCPVLFAWNGERFAFVTDLLGVGGLGFFVEPGVAATPRPWEYLLLPEDAIASRDGEFVFKLTEPMEEIAYLDHARLHVYDLPPDLDLVLDERMAIAGPAATGRALFYADELLPLQAFNAHGADVTSRVTARDLEAAPVGPLDRRFIGRLAQRHRLTLDFERPIDRGAAVLIIDGWVEYPYSQTVFAAWQAGAAYEAPTLEAYGADGRWHVVHEQFGYPAGMPRRMALPLPKLPHGTMRLRLTTNLEVYFDRIAVAFTQPHQPAHRVIEPRAARQRLIGFPRRTTAAQRLPDYDYEVRDAFWDTRYPRGDYSAFGPVLELVAETDDAVAVIGPGEEVELRFTAPSQPPPGGWQRRYVLEVRGWAKDMDLYTYDGGTVGPLPQRAAQRDARERDRLHARYHTRFQSGF